MNVQNFGMDSPAKEIYEHKKTKNERNEKNFNKKCLASSVEIMKEFANSSAATSAYDLIGGKQWWLQFFENRAIQNLVREKICDGSGLKKTLK